MDVRIAETGHGNVPVPVDRHGLRSGDFPPGGDPAIRHSHRTRAAHLVVNAVEDAHSGSQDWKNTTKIVTDGFHGDGRDDVVITTGDGPLLPYGNGQGGLSDGMSMCPETSWKSVQAILGGDFDGNGRTDLGSLWNDQQK